MMHLTGSSTVTGKCNLSITYERAGCTHSLNGNKAVFLELMRAEQRHNLGCVTTDEYGLVHFSFFYTASFCYYGIQIDLYTSNLYDPYAYFISVRYTQFIK